MDKIVTLKFSQDQVDWAVRKVAQMDNLKGFPPSEASLRAYAEAFLRICHPLYVLGRKGLGIKLTGDDLVDAFAVDHTIIEDFTGEEYITEDLSTVTITHSKTGTIYPADWLISQALDRFKFFPPPIYLREIFTEYFPPADGRDDYRLPQTSKGED